jgi:hypothetical protein
MSDSVWYNPLSWDLPDILHLEVDWDRVRTLSRARADEELAMLRVRATTDAPGVGRFLEQTISETERNKEQFVNWMGDVQTRNMQSVQKATDDYASNVEVARFFRDISADGLMVGASLMTGGAAMIGMGSASVFKGYGKFQDSASIGAGVMEASGTFVYGFVKLGRTFSFADEMLLAVVQAQWQMQTELVAGQSVTSAAISGGAKLTGPMVDSLLNVRPARSLFDKLTLPVMLSYKGKFVTAAGDDLASKTAQGLTGEVLKKGLEIGAAKMAAPAPEKRVKRSGQVIEHATLSNKYLLYFAYVNMSKGIGRGW